MYAVTFIYTRFHYVDILSLCNIAIDKDFLKGNRETIVQAITQIKTEDKSAYKTVCKYVDLISENFCPVDHAYGGPFTYNNQSGCYIKGSKVIFINPDKSNYPTVINQRAESIKKYADLSKNYWDYPVVNKLN